MFKRPDNGHRRRMRECFIAVSVAISASLTGSGVTAAEPPVVPKATPFPSFESDLKSQRKTLFIELTLRQGVPVAGRAIGIVRDPAPFTFSALPTFVARLIDDSEKVLAAVSIWDPSLLVKAKEIGDPTAPKRTFERSRAADGLAVLPLPFFPSVHRVDLYGRAADRPLISIGVRDAYARYCQTAPNDRDCKPHQQASTFDFAASLSTPP